MEIPLAAGHFWQSRERGTGLTTEMAALVTFFTGGLCYWDYLRLGAALGVGTGVLLSLKVQTHELARTLDREDVFATPKFAIITVIVLPLLPRQGCGPSPSELCSWFEGAEGSFDRSTVPCHRMSFLLRLLLGPLLAGLLVPRASVGQAPGGDPDSSQTWHEDAWTPVVEQHRVRIAYIYYPEADSEHDGVVLRLINDNDVPVRYAFTLIFRSPQADTSTAVRGRLAPGQMKTGEEAGLFWIPFRDQDRSLGEIGLRGLNIWQDPRSRQNEGRERGRSGR